MQKKKQIWIRKQRRKKLWEVEEENRTGSGSRRIRKKSGIRKQEEKEKWKVEKLQEMKGEEKEQAGSRELSEIKLVKKM